MRRRRKMGEVGREGTAAEVWTIRPDDERSTAH